MGISDLYKVLDKICPNAVRKGTSLSQLQGWRFAIDASVFFHKFGKSADGDAWLEMFVMLLTKLRKYDITPICVFDGPNPPPEKQFEQAERRRVSDELRKKCAILREMKKEIDEKIKNGDPVTDMFIEKVKLAFGRNASKVNLDNKYDIQSTLTTKVAKLEKQTTPITIDFRGKIIEVLEILGVPYCCAPGEAETLCVALVEADFADAVFTEDTDVLAYGVKAMVSKFDSQKDTVCWISHEAIREDSGYSLETFRDLCILLSCDYNTRVKGMIPDIDKCTRHIAHRKPKKPFSIGPESAICMIDIYRSLDECEKYFEDATPLNFRRCRELFTIPEFDFSNLIVTTEFHREKLEAHLSRIIDGDFKTKWILSVWS